MKFDGLFLKILLAALRALVDFFDDGEMNGSSDIGK
jgi:hypothetical protein